MNKKGNYSDIVSWVKFIIMFIIVAGITVLFVQNFDNNVQSNPEIDNVVKQGSQTYRESLPIYFDYIFLSVFTAAQFC